MLSKFEVLPTQFLQDCVAPELFFSSLSSNYLITFSHLGTSPSSDFCSQKRSHSLPHRYKSRNLSLTPTSTPTSHSRPLRQPCYSPDEFHRGIQAMQSWFRNLDDNQRTLALQSITVGFLKPLFIRSVQK